MLSSKSGAAASCCLVLACLSPENAAAQAAGVPVALPDIVVTAGRRPEPIGRTGSAISVLTREEIETFNPTSLTDALRSVPGLDVTETGGPGAVTTVRLRGANTGQTLVLLDGIRINDPSSAAGEFDFSNLLPTAIDRIEVLRGPQSALYGSDAIGGVVNIITRAGGGAPRFEARTEAGSYGTLSTSASAFGSTGPWAYAFSAGGQRSDGFSRYGFRVRGLENRFGRRFEADDLLRGGGYGRIGHDAGEGVKLEAGILSIHTSSQIDAATGNFPDTPGQADRTLTQIWARGTAETGPLTHTLQVYANQTDREFDQTSFTVNRLPANTRVRDGVRGDRVGTEYQGDLKLDGLGNVVFGGRFEAEKASTFSTGLLPVTPRRRTLDQARQENRSIFALWQLPIGERIILSLGGRHDEANAVDFNTFRATGAYLIPETGTKLRASGGTGGKAPTLFQLFDPTFGSPGLRPEDSIGWDVGIDQTLFNGRAVVSVTGFGNKFQDLIEFSFLRPPGQNYFNVTRAESSGIEVEGRVDLIPEWLKLTAAYTYLHAKDESTNLTLPRRPEHVARVAIGITPLPGWLIEPRVTVVSERFSGANETGLLAPYARVDLYSEYRIDKNWRVFGRIENILDQRYEEVLNFGTTGLAAYGGFSVTW